MSKIHPADNWGWFKVSYIQYLNGEFDKAIQTLTEYFMNYMKFRKVSSMEEMGRDIFYASYLFTRGLYYLTNGQNEPAETDFKLAVTGMLETFLAGKKYPYIPDYLGWLHSGVLMETGDKRELASLLHLMTGKDFPWDDDLDEGDKKNRVQEWKKWWENKGKNQKLNLEAIKKQYTSKEK